MRKITFLVAALCATLFVSATTITINESSITWGTAYANCPASYTFGGQNFNLVNLVKGQVSGDSCLQFSKLTDTRAAGYIANAAELNLTSVVITKIGSYQNLSVYAGATATNLTVVTLVEDGSTFTATMPTGTKFFKAINESSYAATCAAIAINIQGESGVNNTKANNMSMFVANRTLMVEGIADGTMIEIYSATGARIMMQELVNGQVQLDNLSKGVYVVRAGNEKCKIVL
ncbi:MAG: hypothetical protein EOM76_06365 [Sphingobacteriia bacterium]|nr:hypothetical protein [Sphingobacteriia bacterium]